MSALDWFSSSDVAVEIETRRLRVAHNGSIREWPLERAVSGRLTEECQALIRTELQAHLGRKQWQPRNLAWCAIPGHGVSLRRWRIPRTPAEDLPRVLRLQLESEFPLPPSELAWGWLRLGSDGPVQEFLVAAVKREVVEEYTELLRACGLSPSVTLSSLARDTLCPATGAEHSMVDFGTRESEWLASDSLGPTRLRVLAGGEERLREALVLHAAIVPDGAAEAVDRWMATGDSGSPALQAAATDAIQGLAALVPATGLGQRLFLTGRLAANPAFVALLAARLAPTVICESLEVGPVSDLSAALRGLHRLASQGSAARMLKLEARSPEPTAVLSRPAPRKWAIAGAILLLGLITLPYLEAFLLYPRLAGRVQQVKANRSRLEIIDREADFLRHLKQTQAPYLDTLYVIGNCTPPGAHVDSFSVNRKGEMSLRVSVRQPPEVTAFRTKLVDSGFFSTLVIEEQAPSQDRQKISVRISGQLKPTAERQGLAILSTNAPAATASPTMPMPGGAPPPNTGPPPAGGPPAPRGPTVRT